MTPHRPVNAESSALNPITLCFLDPKLEKKFALLRYTESGAPMLVFVVLLSCTAFVRLVIFPWTWPGCMIRVMHHVSLLGVRYVLDRRFGLARASAIFPWCLCTFTWIAGITFACLHYFGLLELDYYTPPNKGRNWMEPAFIVAGDSESLDAQHMIDAACAPARGWWWLWQQLAPPPSCVPPPPPPLGSILRARFEAFLSIATGFTISSFAVRRIGIPHVPRVLTLLGVCVPFLSICSAYDQASWLTVICALAMGELLHTPLEKRWRRQYLEGIGAAAGDQRNLQRRESESVPLPADGRPSSFDGLLETSTPSSVFFAVAFIAAGGLAVGMLFGANSHMMAAVFGGTLFCGTIYLLLEVDLSIVKRIQLKQLWCAAAEALQVNSKETESAIASFMFHELRNDQNAISGFLAILTDELGTDGSVLSPAHQRLLKDARLHAHHANQVITNMLELSKLRANKLTLPSETFEVDKLCGECAVLVKHLLSGTPVELRIEVEPELPPMRGSPFHIKQVLLNLLTNACKYTERGSIVLRVEHRAKAKASAEMADEAVAARLHFAIMDTGSGVEPERQRLIFTPYTKGPRVGTGLGLPLSRALVKLMGGDLVLTSMMGAGSTFAFEVTLRAAPRSAPPQSAHAKTADTVATASALVPTALRVLVADDIKINRLVLKHAVTKVLPSTALHFSECASGEAALELLSSKPGSFEVVFLDEHYGVDSMSGTDVTRAYRAIEQEPRHGVTKPALIIGCSADVGIGAFDEVSRSAGQNASVGKPLLEDLLRSTLLGLESVHD